MGVVGIDGADFICQKHALKQNPANKEIPRSGALGGAAVPGAFGTENFANETGLKDVGFFTDPVRV
jgi:hypothetical protein